MTIRKTNIIFPLNIRQIDNTNGGINIKSLEKLEEAIRAIHKEDLRDGQKHLEPLKMLFRSIEESRIDKKIKLRMISETALMLGECNFWIVWFNLAEKDQEAQYCTEARSWYETAYYTIGSFPDYGAWRHVGEISRRLDSIEKSRVLDRKDTGIEGNIFDYFMEHGFLKVCLIENRIKATPETDHNQIAILLLQKADCLYGTGVYAPYLISANLMAYELCKIILNMQDKGIDLWPGIIHKTILFVFLRYPAAEYEKASDTWICEYESRRYKELYALLERGLKNAEYLEGKSRQEIIGSFIYAVRRLKKFSKYPDLNII